MTGRAIMIQGVASSVGKSLLTAALCRVYARRGLNVAPFKAQNMSNNAAVTHDGEIGRAQALQARAARVEPSVHMNPVLLKPEHGGRSQIVVLGKAIDSRSGRDYLTSREELWPVVTTSLDRLLVEHEIVVIEGAGSPAEVNLRQWDIVNMRVACYARAPVLLVADIDRGGALASLVGTMALLESAERALVRGFLINRFRGDESLLRPALDFLYERTGVSVLGVIPYINHLRLPSEDSAGLEVSAASPGLVDVVAIRLPHVSNFDDVDPLMEIGASVRWIADPRALGAPSLIVIPGSKSTRADLDFLWTSGLAASIRSAATRGALILGICGGFQMLGRELVDPDGLEGPAGSSPGLGLLEARTIFRRQKVTRQAQGRIIVNHGPLASANGALIHGYEIHDGQTEHTETPFLSIDDDMDGRPQGAVNRNGRVIGTYLHGLLHNECVLNAIAEHLGLAGSSQSYDAIVESELDRIADAVTERADMRAIDKLLGLK
ncbi:MAG TPA: cobyric acid synthase [Chloroflexota bacterium]|nr:cobyric acid synthase [Chloroflexota bacterium]